MPLDAIAARKVFSRLMREQTLLPKPWVNSAFLDVKVTSTTKKGELGEMFFERILQSLGYSAYKPEGGRDHYDVLATAEDFTKEQFIAVAGVGQRNTRKMREDALNLQRNHRHIKSFEVKVATQDVNGKFQFNGVRDDTVYSHLFCLGISPDDLHFLYIPKRVLRERYNLVPMTKGTNATFKVTIGLTGDYPLMSFDSFERETASIIKKQ